MPKQPLHTIATARSGDKGSHVNIGIIARTPEAFEFLKNILTEEVVLNHFKSLQPKKVIRYTLPFLEAFNFTLFNVLEGGGSRSPRIDSQGKTFGQALLLLELDIPEHLIT